jgi:hypothetical protein
MANKVANVDDVTAAISGKTLTDRASRKALRLPALHDLPSNLVRSHLHQLPDAAEAVAGSPAIESPADAAGPSFAAVGKAAAGRGAITAMASNAFDGRLFVANYADDSVAVLDGHSLAMVGRITDTPEPYALAVTRGRAYIGTVTAAYDAVVVADSNSVVATHPLAAGVQDIVVDREGRQVYVARTGRDGADLAVIDTSTGDVRTVDLGGRPGEVANAMSISGDGRRVYLGTTDQFGGRMIVVDTAALQVVNTFTVVEPVRDLAANHDGSMMWVATDNPAGGGLVDVVDMRTQRVASTVEIGSAVRQMMLSAVEDRVYVVTDEAVTVVCANTHQVVDTITTGSAPSCIAESADGSRLYVAGFDGQVSLFSVASTTPSVLARMATPEALAGPAVLELDRAGV